MTTEATAVDKTLATQGATTDDLNAGSGDNAGAPKAPVDNGNTPPPKPNKEGIDETNDVVIADDPAKVAADRAAAEAAAKAKEAADKEAAGPLKDYTSFPESPAATAAIDLLKEAGVGPNEANTYFAEAIKTGDLSKVDVKGLEAKLGKSKATLVMAGVTAHYEGLAQKSAQTVTQVHEIFGGADNWTTVRTWAQTSEKADPALKAKIDGIRGMIDEGGYRAEAGARELLRLYNAAPATKGLGTNKLAVGDSTGTVIGTYLSRADYLTELKAAHDKGASPAVIRAIDARRRAGKAAGI
jgi:hypothetical protein